MYVLHGTWVPRLTDEFVQSGEFLIWLETGATRATPPGYAAKYLQANDLATVLADEWAFAKPGCEAVRRRLHGCHLRLPISADGKGLPSPELAHWLGMEVSDEHMMGFADTVISAYPLDNGTPVENRLLDLWSIFNFLNPGYLGTQSQFRKQFELPIQKDGSPTQSSLLKKLVQPFILRRVKTDKAIIRDLPGKVEHKQYCHLTREQASLYEAVVKDVEKDLEAAEGMKRKGLILATLMRLKQICNHPRQFLQDASPFTPERSHKLERLTEMLEEVIGAGESLLIFSQFTEVAEALEKYLRALHYPTYYLHGGTPRVRREQMINAFQNPDSAPAAFILPLKAGGVGITLTRANHVFHFDRWWNPAVEDQATDRAFRIGQTRNVFVHKFITLGTLEERIDQMLEDKKQVAGLVVGADEAWLTELDNASFKRLIALNRQAVLD
ncbi:MAG: DEAD/DEAH box helicase [Gammaproteobacteria bacterium]|nr:DEAD/DEAH box helicase [Gammaproteobacteria bacterium]MCP5424224.1 DEAD/DEAH box helicase [Gammaproteobacteria bacterium]